MKKVLYIGLAIVGLGLASCSKQDIQPNSGDPVVPVWKANTGGGDNVTEPSTGGSNDGGITDPEHNQEQSSNTDGL